MSEAPAPADTETEFEDLAPRRRPTLRLVLSIALALAAVLALYTFQPGWFAVPAAAPVHHTPAPTATARPPVQPYLYIGDEQRFENVSITPLSVNYTYGSGAMQANRGDVFAIVMLLIVNHTGADYTLASSVGCTLPYCNYFVSDSLGEKNPPVNYDPNRTRLRSVVLQDGGHQIGSYTFEVPERDARDHLLQLLYYPNPVLDTSIVKRWLLEPRPRHG